MHLIMMLQRLFTLPQNQCHPIIYTTRKINYNKQQWRTWCTDDRNDIATTMYVCDYFIIEPFDVKLVWIFDFAHTFIHYCLFQRNVCPMTRFIHPIGSSMSHCDNRTKHRITLNYIAQSMLLRWASIARACLQKMYPIWMRWWTTWICNRYIFALISRCVRNVVKLRVLMQYRKVSVVYYLSTFSLAVALHCALTMIVTTFHKINLQTTTFIGLDVSDNAHSMQTTQLAEGLPLCWGIDECA